MKVKGLKTVTEKSRIVGNADIEESGTTRSFSTLYSIMESLEWNNSTAKIPIVLGVDELGKPVISDLASLPHLLIVGSTGTGKSVLLNSFIMNMIGKFAPADLRLMLFDPKNVFKPYAWFPYLIIPVVNNPMEFPEALNWVTGEMERRYNIFYKTKTHNLSDFNTRPETTQPFLPGDWKEVEDKLPLLVIIVDELADIMVGDARCEVEMSIARIAQKGRAAGIHMMISTRMPNKKIITPVINANIVSRIAFRVPSAANSRLILGRKGAERLLGRGEMLFRQSLNANPVRIQSA